MNEGGSRGGYMTSSLSRPDVLKSGCVLSAALTDVSVTETLDTTGEAPLMATRGGDGWMVLECGGDDRFFASIDELWSVDHILPEC